MAGVQHIQVYLHVVFVKTHLIFHVGEQSAHSRRQMNDVSWPQSFEQGGGLLSGSQVAFLRAQKVKSQYR